MSYLHVTRDYNSVMSFIVGHEYVTAACRQGATPVGIMQAVLEYVGDGNTHKPFIILNTERLYPEDFEDFLALELHDLLVE